MASKGNDGAQEHEEQSAHARCKDKKEAIRSYSTVHTTGSERSSLLGHFLASSSLRLRHSIHCQWNRSTGNGTMMRHRYPHAMNNIACCASRGLLPYPCTSQEVCRFPPWFPRMCLRCSVTGGFQVVHKKCSHFAFPCLFLSLGNCHPRNPKI